MGRTGKASLYRISYSEWMPAFTGGKDWKGISIQDFILRVDAYIHWYNERRIKMSLRGLSPLEFRSKIMKDKTIA